MSINKLLGGNEVSTQANGITITLSQDVLDNIYEKIYLLEQKVELLEQQMYLALQ